MADKEATVFVLDLGASMAEAHSGRKESDLDWSMRYVWDKITDIVASNRKTLCVGVIGLRTDETSNKLDSDDGYGNLSVLQELGPMTMPSLRTLQNSIKTSSTWSGDAISAIVLAVDMIDTFTKKLKWVRKIVLVTDAQGAIDADDIGDIAKKMNDSNIQLTVLGVDFDDPEYGFKEEDKSSIKAENEKSLRSLVESCNDGVFASIMEAIDEIETPRIKTVKPYKSYDGTLTLGDPSKFPAAMNINVERYFKTHLARPLTASTVVIKAEQGTQSTQTLDDDPMEGVEFSAVKQARTYKVNDPDAPGGKKDVEFESLAKGYEYGRTAVHISESEYNITKIETLKSFSILGFIPWSKYEPFLNMGEVGITHARKFDEKSELAMSSLVWALSELESYAVARIVTKDGKDPTLVLLAPHIEPDFECLYDIPLPFAEDVRQYQFPPLDKVITITGQTIMKHRLLPTDELNEAMSDYVDSMDLSAYGIDDEGNPAEFAPADETFNPSIHRINSAVKHRAVHPNQSVPDTPSILLRFASPPEDLVQKAQSHIDTLIETAEVKKVPPKAKGRYKREAIKPISGLDVDALLGGESKGKVSPENAVPDYKRALAASDQMEEIQGATKQMGTIIRSLITDSFAGNKYEQAVECIGTMREELINFEEPGMYNAFVRDLKKNLLSGALGGDRRWVAPTVPNPKCADVSGCGPYTKPNKRNPDYKGKWTAPYIDNPAYKGPWAPRKIKNPGFFEDKTPANFEPMGAIGFELWTMQNDILFDNIYIGHSIEDANKLAEEAFKPKHEVEEALAEADKPKEEDAPKSPSDLKFMDDPVLYVREKLDLFLTIAQTSPLEAIKFVPEIAAGIGGLLISIIVVIVTVLGGGSAPAVKKAAGDAKAKAKDAKDKAAEAIATGAEKAKNEAKKRNTRSAN